MNIDLYIQPKTFLETCHLAKKLVETLETDKLKTFKADLNNKLDYLKKTLKITTAKKECESLAENTCDLYTSLTFYEKLAFKPKHRNQHMPYSPKEQTNKKRKERHYLKNIKTEDDLKKVTENIKQVKQTRFVTPKTIHEFNNSKEKNPRLTSFHCGPEYFTPPQIAKLAREVLSGIDLDPASHESAQKYVQATKYFTEKDDGLKQQWFGKIWLNPPYQHKVIDLWIDKLATENYKRALILLNNNTETLWFQKLLKISNALCLIKGRLKFWHSEGEHENTALQGQIIAGIKVDKEKFKQVFSAIGQCYFN